MADNKVKFLRGTSDEYTAAEKDNDVIYFTTDDGKLYIGDKEILGGSSYELPIATTEILGGVIPDGTSITVDENGVISAVGGSDDWTNFGNVYIAAGTEPEFSIPNLSNYKFMMLSISMMNNDNYAYNYTRILALDDFKHTPDYYGPVYYIGDDYSYTAPSSPVYPYIAYAHVNKSVNYIRFVGRVSFYANIYVK